MVLDTRMFQFSVVMKVIQVLLWRYSMKPTRIRMCHSLVMNYGLYKRMEIFVSEPDSQKLLAPLAIGVLAF